MLILETVRIPFLQSHDQSSHHARWRCCVEYVFTSARFALLEVHLWLLSATKFPGVSRWAIAWPLEWGEVFSASAGCAVSFRLHLRYFFGELFDCELFSEIAALFLTIGYTYFPDLLITLFRASQYSCRCVFVKYVPAAGSGFFPEVRGWGYGKICSAG